MSNITREEVDERLGRLRDEQRKTQDALDDYSKEWVTWATMRWVLVVLGLGGGLGTLSSGWFSYSEHERLFAVEAVLGSSHAELSALRASNDKLDERIRRLEGLSQTSALYNQLIAQKLGVTLPEIP